MFENMQRADLETICESLIFKVQYLQAQVNELVKISQAQEVENLMMKKSEVGVEI
jgi:predicted XRE-type DNA-binding protein